MIGSTVDVQGARRLLDEIDPEQLDDDARALRTAEPALSALEALDRALRDALARRRADVSRETFAYLRWRVEQAWLVERAGDAAFGTPHQARDDAWRRPDPAPPQADARIVSDAGGRRWTVREAGPNDLFGAGSPRWLIFRSEGEERRTSAYLPDWASLPDAAVLALLPAR